MKHTFPAVAVALILLAGCDRKTPGTNQPVQPGPWLETPVVVATPAAAGSRYPNLASTQDGSLTVMSWLEPVADDGGFRLRYAIWRNAQWDAPVDVASGKDWFINWADFPSVMPSNNGPWAAHWLQQKPGDVYSYDVMVRLSEDGGRTWSPQRSPHDDGTPTEHGFVSLASINGKPYAVWLDGRETVGEGHGHGDGSEHAEHAAPAGAMTVRGAELQVNGANKGAEIDHRVCDCCSTDIAATREGLVLVYRDRSEDETRDIYATRFVDGQWQPSIAVHDDGWRINACPVNGPAVAAKGDTVVVAWFTAPPQGATRRAKLSGGAITEAWAQAPEAPRVRLAWSTDGGRSFGQPIEVSNSRVVGRVDVVLLDDGRAVVSWLADRQGGGILQAQPFWPKGVAGGITTIAQTDVARSSGFPQMTRVPGGLLFAWTTAGATPAVVTARAALP